MKLYAIFLMNRRDPQKVLIVTSARDLSSFNMFQRSSASEFLAFLARAVAQRVSMGRSQVKEKENIAYCLSSFEGLCAIAVCDTEYNDRVAFSMLNEVMQAFAANFTGRWEGATADNCVEWPALEQTLKKYQKPEEADKILRLKKEISETKVVMYEAIDQLLERGEKLDDLIKKSDDLGTSSKAFYKTAKKTNSCCVIS